MWQMQQCNWVRCCLVQNVSDNNERNDGEATAAAAEEKEMDLGRCFPDRTARKRINMHALCSAVPSPSRLLCSDVLLAWPGRRGHSSSQLASQQPASILGSRLCAAISNGHGGAAATSCSCAARPALPLGAGQQLLVGGGAGVAPRGAEQPAGVPAGTLRRAAVRHLLHHPARPEPPHVRLSVSVSAIPFQLGNQSHKLPVGMGMRRDGDRIHFAPPLASAAGGCTGSSRR